MNTTAAAIQANVAIPAVRTWCRTGAVAAVKLAGRWVIDAASLARRITIGKLKEHRMTEQPKYRIEEGKAIRYGEERPTWTIVRTDGTPPGHGEGKDNRISDPVFFARESAEFYAEFYERTPVGYRISRETRRGRSWGGGTTYWLLAGCTSGDPQSLRTTLETDWAPKGNWPEDTRHVDVLIKWANEHAAGAAGRIAKKAEADAIEAAEAAVREARQAQLAQARAKKGPLATERQVDFILQLLAERELSGEGGGFVVGYPTDRAGIEELSKGQASIYITSLKGDY